MNSSLLFSHFSIRHYWLPLSGFILAAVILAVSPLDLVWADQLYRWSGGYWRFEDAWFTSTLVHEGGRTVVGILALGLILATVLATLFTKFLTRFFPAIAAWRKGLLYLVASTLLAGVVINILKEFTHVDCPWDLLSYGGDRPYVPIFSAHPGNFEAGACFPAGHASAAYAWLGVYYFCLILLPRWRFRALAAVLGAGLLFGFSQQLRGAHFLSHDLWTLGICWAIASGLFHWVFPGWSQPASKKGNIGEPLPDPQNLL